MGLLDYLNTPSGMGLLSAAAGYAANARRGTPVNNIGRGLAAGMIGYSQANEQQKALEKEQAQREALARIFNPVPTQQTAYKANGKTFASPQKATEYVQAFDPAQELGSALAGEFGAKKLPENTDFSQYATAPFVAPNVAPKMNIEATTEDAAQPMSRQQQVQAAVMSGLIPPAEGFKLLADPRAEGATAEMKNWQFAQGLPEEQRKQFLGNMGAAGVPSTVQEWQYFSGLNPEQRALYLEMKRNPQIMNLGGYQAVRAPGGGVRESYEVTPKITDTPQYQAAQESARVTAQEGAKRDVKASSDLPRIQANAANVRNMVNGILNHPGFSSTVGITALPGARFIPGTKEADFMSRMDQLKGSAFLQAFETLKGGGQITEVEGKKATDAINRMSISTSEKEFRNAAQDFLSVVDRAEQNALRAAGAQDVTPDQARVIQERRAAGVPDSKIVEELNGKRNQAAGTFKDPINVTNDADYNSVPKGKYYKAPDGSIRLRK